VDTGIETPGGASAAKAHETKPLIMNDKAGKGPMHICGMQISKKLTIYAKWGQIVGLWQHFQYGPRAAVWNAPAGLSVMPLEWCQIL
jgi:hypothetical protein